MLIQHPLRARLIFSLLLLIALVVSAPHNFQNPYEANGRDLQISEMVAVNNQSLLDEDGDHSDWIELYNQGSRPIQLVGWSLTDDPDRPEKWPLPDFRLESQQYLIVFASGKDRTLDGQVGLFHTNFKLNDSGGFLGLYYRPSRQFVEIVSPEVLDAPRDYPQQLADIAFGRCMASATEACYGYFTHPTPGAANDAASYRLGLVPPIQFSQPRGFFEHAFQLELSTVISGTTIRYTTDGSLPTPTHGTVYSDPLTIEKTTLLRAAAFKDRFLPSAVATQSYLFFDDILTQSATPSGFPTTWGGYEGAPIEANYEMDPAVVNDPRFADQMITALQSIPSLSLVMDRRSFFELYTNPERRGRAWERPISVELLDPNGDQPGFQLDAGLRIQGDTGRQPNLPKHSFRLFFRQEYGAARLNYPLFPDGPIQSFDTLILRSGMNRSYAGWPDSDQTQTTYTRDEWLRESQRLMSGSGARGTFVHLYMNGLYWGLYNLVERPDAAFMADQFGGDEADWQTISHRETLSHTSERFARLHKLVSEGRLDGPERYEIINSYLDIPQFIDYLILNWYSGNLDWGFNNWYATTNERVGPIKYYVWDGERTWYEGAELYTYFDEYNGWPNLVKPMLEALLANPDFRQELADRLYHHLYHDGVLTEAAAKARWQNLTARVETAVIAESARWGDTWSDEPITQVDWFRARDEVLAQMDGNVAYMITQARELGYYPAIDPPQFSRPMGQLLEGHQLALTAVAVGQSAIYFTIDGTDPRLPVTGGVAPTAQHYQQPLTITDTVHLKVRLFDGQQWSALNEAVFFTSKPELGQLQITEIMYHPMSNEDLEFLEMSNQGMSPVDLGGLTFEGIHFTFPAAARPLAPGQSVLLVRDRSAFVQHYPGVTVDGVFQGRLANEGETLRLIDPTGQVLLSVTYDDENGWPLSADGHGDSLELVNQQVDPNMPEAWQASTLMGGSPGEESAKESTSYR